MTVRGRARRLAAAGAASAALAAGGCGSDVAQKRGPVDYRADAVTGSGPATTAALRGKPALLTTWATWCPPCRKELPKLQRLYERERARGLQVVAVNIDGDGPSVLVRRMIGSLGLTMPIWSDPDNRFRDEFHGIGVPTSVLLDRHGRVVRVWQGGADPRSSDTARAIGRALAQPG